VSRLRPTPVRIFLCALLAVLTCLYTLPAWAGGADRLGEAQRVVLPNNMVILTAQNDTSDIAGVQLFLRVDACREPMGREGIRAVLQFLILSALKKNAEQTPALEPLQQDLDVGGVLDAATDAEYVEFAAVETSQVLPETLAQLRNVFELVITSEALERAKEATLKALERRKSDAAEHSYRLFREALNRGGQPARSPLGTPESVGALTVDQAAKFHRRWYVPANAVVAIVSPLKPAQAIRLATEAFAGIPAGKKAGTWRPGPKPGNPCRIRVEGSPWISTASMVVGWPAPGLGDPDHGVAVVVAALLGEGEQSRLAQDRALRRSRALNFAPTLQDRKPTTILSGIGSEGHIAVYTDAALWAIDDVKNHIAEQFERLKTEPVAPGELEAAKCRAINSLALQYQTTRAQSYALGRFEVLGLGYNYVAEIVKHVEAVTPEDVQRIARTYFNKAAIGIEMPLMESPDVLGRIGAKPPTSPMSPHATELFHQP